MIYFSNPFSFRTARDTQAPKLRPGWTTRVKHLPPPNLTLMRPVMRIGPLPPPPPSLKPKVGWGTVPVTGKPTLAKWSRTRLQ
jgi:hypothetical protein